MELESLPPWVPLAVKKVAVGMQVENDQVRRFLTDAKMQNVWKYLLRRKVDSIGLDVAPMYNSLTESELSISQFGIAERACAAVYLAVLEVSLSGDYYQTKKDLSDITKRYIETATNCSWIIKSGLISEEAMSKELLSALKMVEEHCKYCSGVVSQGTDPRRLDGRSGLRGDDVIRAHVRKLATTTRALYGEALVGTLVKIANVVLAPTKPITPKSVENWVKDMPLPNFDV